ncbi:MAG: NAD-dependent epimerase/dehydratase family protein [Sulfuricellaceae bacterium]|nr:NAD-dependent epimerase/dehydratase family protein [Sulfuricellaceae bacterium]
MKRSDVLLLGGGGFIGTALANKLAGEGLQVYVLAPNAPPSATNTYFRQGGMDNPELLAKLLSHCGTVIHLASASTPGSSGNHPSLELENLAPSLRLLEALLAYPETHLIFFSSGGTLYGNPQRLPVHEDDPVTPLSYHGAGKAALEAFLHAFRARGQNVTILRPSNAYGPGQALKSGFGLIRTLLEHARCGTPLDIWGDGENVRDFIYIDDITEACARFVALPQDNGTYNLGSGRRYSINQVRRIVEQVAGVGLKTAYHPAREIDVRAVVLDISRIEARLSWKPGISLDEGVRRTWEWLREA